MPLSRFFSTAGSENVQKVPLVNKHPYGRALMWYQSEKDVTLSTDPLGIL